MPPLTLCLAQDLAALPSPEKPEALAVQRDNRVWFDNPEQRKDLGADAIEPGEDQPASSLRVRLPFFEEQSIVVVAP